MKAFLVFTTMFVVVAARMSAQTVTEEPQPDPVMDAIHEFDKQDQAAATPTKPGKNPEEQPAEIAAPKPPAVVAAPEEIVDSKNAEPEDGLTVRVEKLQSTKGIIDPGKVKLLAPFPAKPLAQAPVGWHLEAANSAPPFLREVEISEGSKITLTIRPHLLVPDADGEHAFSIRETGYDHSLGYQQQTTVAAILATSVRQLDDDSIRLGAVIDNLQQLLISLPKPEEPIKEAPEPAKPGPTRKK